MKIANLDSIKPWRLVTGRCFPYAELVALLTLFAAPAAFAATYYWDNNGSTNGFGTAAGTWADPTIGDATQGWSTDATGLSVPGNVTTTTSDDVFFGNFPNGLAAGNITVSGSVSNANMTFPTNSGGAIVLTNGTIYLADTTTITVSNSTTIASALAGAAVNLTKAGAGTLTLSGNNTFTGTTAISEGLLALNHASALGGAGNVTFSGGTVSYNANSAGIDLSSRIKNSVSNIVLRLNGQSVTYAGSIDNSSSAGLQVTGAGTGVGGILTVSAINSYGGNTTIGNSSGSQDAASITVSGAGTLGSGTIIIGPTGNLNGSLLALTGGASLNNAITLGGRTTNNINIQNLAGTSTLSGTLSVLAGGGFCAIQSDAGLLQLTGTSGGGTALTSSATGARTATLQGAGDGLVSGAILNGSATPLSLTKAGAGTWTLSGLSATAANNYTGTTAINQGTLAITTTDPAFTGGLSFGATTNIATVGALDLSAASATFPNLVVQSTNAAATNLIIIGSGRTLTFTASTVANVVAVGTLMTNNSAAKLQVTGANGTLTVNDTSRNIVVASLNSGATNQTLDLSGLGNFNATIANLYVGRPTAANGNASSPGTVKNDFMTLAATNTITATNRIVVGAAQQSGSTLAKLRLGTTSVLNGASFVIGSSRASGTMEFAAANGSVTLRGAAGGSARTDIFMGDQTNLKGVSQNAGGSSSVTGTMNFTGGSVDARIESLMLGLGAGSGATHPQGNGNFTMDGASSIVDINTLVIAQDVDNASTNSGTSSIGTFTVANGVLQVNTAATLANDIDSSATLNGTQNLFATFTVAGGTATIGSAGTPVNLILGNHVNAGNPGTNTVAVSLTGGTLNVFGDLKEGNLGAGTILSALGINGGTLDMKGSNITSLDSITYTNGTLKNLGVVNTGLTLAGTGARVFDQGASISGVIQGVVDGSGVGLVKTGAGTLTLNGTNTYTGNTTVSNGMLVIAVASLATNSTVTVTSGAVLQLGFATTNRVGGLVLNGVSKPNGIYKNSNSSPFITGSGSLEVVSTSPSPATLTNSVTGGVLSLSWPTGQGWRLQSQTNALTVGLSTNWVEAAGSSVSSTNYPIDPTKPTVFYRLIYP